MATLLQTQVGPGALVRLRYALYDEDGDLIESTPPDEPLSYVHGYGQIVPELEVELEGMVEGDNKRVVIEAEGEHDPDRIFEVARSELPDPATVAINDELEVASDDGEVVDVVRVIDVRDDVVVLDANPPLAGQKLHFDVTIEAVRPATTEEIAEAERDLMERDHEHENGCCDGHDVSIIGAERLLSGLGGKRERGISLEARAG
jgi:FKBP-type peptidyl-prolyl cis-trans isomerase SlyD